MQNTPKLPGVLWKYREWKPFAENMIVRGEVYYAALQDLNDPFDFHWNERLPADEQERDRYARELCAVTFPDDTPPQRMEHYTTVLKSMRDLTSGSRNGIIRTTAKFRHGVLCLSEINDNMPADGFRAQRVQWR
jgi:hypothetical protein